MNALDILKQEMNKKRKAVEDLAKGNKFIRLGDIPNKAKQKYEEQKKGSKEIENDIKKDLDLKADDILKDAEVIPRQEAIKKLRERNLPIRLFGEADKDAYIRLRKHEVDQPDLAVGWKNDFHAAQQKAQEEVLDEIIKGTYGRNEKSEEFYLEPTEELWSDIKKRAINIGIHEDPATDCKVVHDFFLFILSRWNNDLDKRTLEEKIHPIGKLQTSKHRQTVEYMRPLLNNLKKNTVNNDVRCHLVNITRLVLLEHDYVQANNAYMELAIGNAPWPVGVTRSGIHQRPGSAKAYVKNIAHVLNDESQRKYIHGVKRIVTRCQEYYPADPSKCVEYMEEDPVQNIEEVLGTTDPVAICQCFEDLLEKDPADSTTWQSYLSYLKEKNLPQIVSAYSKYCRACPDDIFAWQDYIFHLEKYGKEWKILEEAFREAIEYVDDPYSAMTLYRSITYAKLRYEKATSVLDDVEPDYLSVAKLFHEGDNFLNHNFGNSDITFKKNYATFVFAFLKDVELGRKVWKEILASGTGNKPKWWIEAAEQERKFGSVDVARKLLYRGINSVFEKPMELFDYFIQFEREEGTFDQMSKALKKVNDQAARISERESTKKDKKPKEKVQQKGKKRSLEISQDEHQSPMKKNKEQEVVIKDKDGFVVPPIPVRSPRRDRSQSPSNGMTQLPPSLKLDKSPSPKPTESLENRPLNNLDSNSEKTIFISNLDYSLEAFEIKKLFPDCVEVRLIPRAGTNLSKGYGYVDFPTSEAAKEALKMDRTTINNRPVFVSEYNPHEKGEHAEFKYSIGIEVNKLFVKNLPFKCGNKELKEAFQAFGEIKDARVVTKKTGQSKCCGYVEFANEADARRVLSSQIEIGGRSISCFISNPPKKMDKQRPQQKKIESDGGRKSRINAFVPRSVATKRT